MIFVLIRMSNKKKYRFSLALLLRFEILYFQFRVTGRFGDQTPTEQRSPRKVQSAGRGAEGCPKRVATEG